METTTIEAAAIAASSTATLKFQRKCTGRWTTRTSSNFPASAHQPHHHHSNKTRSHRGVARASAGLSSRVKLRSWMAEPLVVKDGDASLRLVTDLPRFNWLELKLSSSSSNKQSSTPASSSRPEVTKQSSITKKETGTERTSNSAPLKVRILEMNNLPSSGSSLNNARRPMETGCDDASQQKTAPAQQVKDELQITTNAPVALPEQQSICRWPLKKRLIVRQEETPTTPPSPISPGSTESKVTYSPLAQRGPVIMRNVILPPTPPASSAPPDLPPLLIQADDMSTSIEEVQEGPLDLSSNERCCPPSEPLLLPIKRRPMQQEDNGRAEVEIIAMTTRTRPPVSVMPSGSSSAFHPPLPVQSHTAPPLIPRCHAPLATEIHGARMERKPVARSIQRVPAIRPSPFPPPESRPSRSSLNGRPFPLPPLRPLPQHWKQVQNHQMQQHQQQHHRSSQLLPSVPIIRPDVQLHPVCPPPPPPPPIRPRTAGAHPHPQQPQLQPHTQQSQIHVQQPHLHQQQQMQHFPRFFHPQQVMGYNNMVIKKPASTPLPVSAPPTQPSQTSSAFPSDWSLRSCVVCSRRADFRCAGCHGNAYCSTLCQARDWPTHSQLCQRGS